MYPILAIDSGNSFTKWGLYNDGHWQKSGKVANEQFFLLENEFSTLPFPSTIIISHVSKSVSRVQLNQVISRWTTLIYWVSAQSSQCDVHNSYLNPPLLGSDRWAALIAAKKLVQKDSCLVINVGTAVTIDVLSVSGVFKGGIILPGLHLMQSCLASETLLPNCKSGEYKDFPVNTYDAIKSGCIHGVLGAIERISDITTLHFGISVKTCVISGGGAKDILPFIKLQNLFVENIVLDGLILIANDIDFKHRNYT